jgi:hypothetical protein
MEEPYPVNVIRRECESIGGFAIELRAGHFLVDQYTELLQAIRDYREMVRGMDNIRRTVAIDLYYLDVELSGALNTHRNLPHYELLKTAQLECSELIIEVFTPESMLTEE